ncbi:hypothetical protein BC834DRAFT_503632 [Gloeopeniophorella convolvens]|nr:hypothetical protein BC834DRAFT_503632 [Gloeopeniophorella convolvens]
MADSDDEYGFDDIVLDDQILAALDATERNFNAARAPRPRPPDSHTPAPPAKRLKTNSGWAPPQVQQPRKVTPPPKPKVSSRFSLEDMDLPEITVNNGFYSNQGHPSTESQQPESPVSQNVRRPGPGMSLASARASVAPQLSAKHSPAPSNATAGPSMARIARNTITPSSRNPATRHASPALTSKPAARTNALTRTSSFSDGMRAALRNAISEVNNEVASSMNASSGAVAPSAHVQPPSQVLLQTQTQMAPRAQPQPLSHLRPRQLYQQRQQQVAVTSQRTSSIEDMSSLKDELAALRSQVQELEKANTEKQQTLDQAVAEKRAKIGEVEILRANLQKTAAVHNEETAKLRAAKESLEAAQLAAQKKQEAELERLRTQLVFKQHEIEASRRAVPRLPASSQAPTSSQIPRFDTGPITPRRPHNAGAQTPSPVRPQKPPARPSKSRSALPGFVNAFAPPPKKDPGRARVPLFEQSQRTRERDAEPPPLSPPSSPVRAPARTQADDSMDVDADSGPFGGFDSDHGFHVSPNNDIKKDLPTVPPSKSPISFDWIGRMRQLVITHSTSTTAPATIQLLFAQPPLEGDSASKFSLASSTLMDALAVGSGESDPIMRIVGDALVQMMNVLIPNTRFKPLAALFNLLTVLSICLPSFTTNLLKSTNGPVFLDTICTLITTHLSPMNTNPKEPERAEERALYLDLARETFGLLDAIIYSLPPAYHSQLVVIPQTPNMLTTMLSKNQPTSFLECSTRTLSYLSFKTAVFRSLLSFPDEASRGARDFAKLPQVDRMCALLIDPSRTGAEGHSIRASVLTTLISLAMAHKDGVTILSETPFLVPSLVTLLANLSTTLWEEEPELMASPSLLSSTVAGLGRGMLLLHYVLFRAPGSAGPGAGLRARLQAAPPRHFNGIGHQFVVALGRLSFAEPPDAVCAADRALLEQLADPARDVMDLVVAGPEGESVWSLFQGEEDAAERGAGDAGTSAEVRKESSGSMEGSVAEADIAMYQDSEQLEYV